MNGAAEPGYSALRLTKLGMLLSLAVSLSLAEQLLPVSAILPAGMKLGLSQVAVMYCLLTVGSGSAILLAVLKSLFVLAVRGYVAALLSVSGGLVSIASLVIFYQFKTEYSFIASAVVAALFHNAGQLAAFSLVSGNIYIALYYAPPLAAAGIITGSLTGTILYASSPLITRALAYVNGRASH